MVKLKSDSIDVVKKWAKTMNDSKIIRLVLLFSLSSCAMSKDSLEYKNNILDLQSAQQQIISTKNSELIKGCNTLFEFNIKDTTISKYINDKYELIKDIDAFKVDLSKFSSNVKKDLYILNSVQLCIEKTAELENKINDYNNKLNDPWRSYIEEESLKSSINKIKDLEVLIKERKQIKYNILLELRKHVKKLKEDVYFLKEEKLLKKYNKKSLSRNMIDFYSRNPQKPSYNKIYSFDDVYYYSTSIEPIQKVNGGYLTGVIPSMVDLQRPSMFSPTAYFDGVIYLRYDRPSKIYNESVFIKSNKNYRMRERNMSSYFIYDGVLKYKNMLGFDKSIYSFKEID